MCQFDKLNVKGRCLIELRLFAGAAHIAETAAAPT